MTKIIWTFLLFVLLPMKPMFAETPAEILKIYELAAKGGGEMMAGLKDHFGENATLEKAESDKIHKFFSDHAADRSAARRSQKIAKSIPRDSSPLRVTETLYFKRQHHEVSPKVWSRKAIGSSSNCVACHSRAEIGVFNEDEVRIPR